MSRLLENSTPAERARKCTFAERFDGAANLALNGGVLIGSATWVSNGLQFNTTSTYIVYSTRNCLTTYAHSAYCGVIEITPSFALNDGVSHRFTGILGEYIVEKGSANGLRIRGGTGTATIIDASYANVSAVWRAGQKNTIAWSCVSGANYMYVNGTLVNSTTNTAWTPLAPSGANQIVIGEAASVGFTGIMHSEKIFIPATAAQALTAKDCEVLSAGTTYTYWDSATCIMDGLAANYDPANYRHLDISGRGNHVLLGNGAGAGTPTKLAAQGYGFNGTTQYMTVPLAAWPSGGNGTIIVDGSYDSSVSQPRLWGTDHTSGTNYESATSVSAGSFRGRVSESGSQKTANMATPETPRQKNIYALTWGGSNTLRGYFNGGLVQSASTTGANVVTPNLSFTLMLYSSDYTAGTLRSFLSFAKELSSIQVADVTLWMRNLRNKV